MHKNIAHAGSPGDIIYHLACIKHFVNTDNIKRKFYIYPTTNDGYRIPQDIGENLCNLIRTQPYLESAEWVDTKPDCFDLDNWRQHYGHRKNLTDMCCDWLKIPHPHREEPWLRIKPKRIARIVINRCPRWRNDNFPWQKILEEYRKEAVFVGYLQEFEEFAWSFGPISYYHTPTHLDAASVIAGCELFVGNQSFCAAIAEGLKMPMIQETIDRNSHLSNCHWERVGKIHVYNNDEKIPHLNEIDDLYLKNSVKKAGKSPIPEDKLYNLAKYAKETRNVPGDVAEVGSGGINVIASILSEKTIHSFDATPEPTIYDINHHTDFPKEKINFSFVHINQNVKNALKYFYPRMFPGGMIVMNNPDQQILAELKLKPNDILKLC